jgi:tRNA-splicing endonuclease subunit Sen54
MELLPEEALYLVERGALLCWKETGHPISATPGLTDIYGSPMTVQQAFAEMLGKEGLSLEHYQV